MNFCYVHPVSDDTETAQHSIKDNGVMIRGCN
jgi:hypothetical protein